MQIAGGEDGGGLPSVEEEGNKVAPEITGTVNKGMAVDLAESLGPKTPSQGINQYLTATSLAQS